MQLLVELTSNLASERHLEAWRDLAAASQQQRVAGQLLASAEQAAVLLAAALGATSGAAANQQQAAFSEQEESFLKVTENAYVAIRQLAMQTGAPVQVTMPSRQSLLATKWMASPEQRITLHLQQGDEPSGKCFNWAELSFK